MVNDENEIVEEEIIEDPDINFDDFDDLDEFDFDDFDERFEDYFENEEIDEITKLEIKNSYLDFENEIKNQKLKLVIDLQDKWIEKENNKINSRDQIICLFTRILSFQLVFIALVVILTAIKNNNFSVPDSVMTVIAGSLIAEIIGVFLIIAKYMFDNQNDKLLDIIEKIIGKH